MLEEVLDIRSRSLGEDNAATSRTRSNLAVVLGVLGRNDEAQQILERELELQLAILGPDHPSTAGVRNSVARQLMRQKKHLEAVEQLREVLRVERLTHGDRELPAAATLHLVAVESSRGDDQAGAEAAIGEALAIRREKLGPDDPETLLSHYWLGQILGKQERWAEAVDVLADCYEAAVRAETSKYPIARESARLSAEYYESIGDAAAASRWRARMNEHS